MLDAGAAAMDVEEAATPKAADTEAAEGDGATRSANGGTPSKDDDGKEQVSWAMAPQIKRSCVRHLHLEVTLLCTG